jgi:hypothetical protein
MLSVAGGKGSTLFLLNLAGYGYCADRRMIVNGAFGCGDWRNRTAGRAILKRELLRQTNFTSATRTD